MSSNQDVHDGIPSDSPSPIPEKTDLEKDPGTIEQHAVVEDQLARRLSARQVQMIAIGGTIGTGLFLGTGKSLATGGPASMLIAYFIVGGIVFVTMLSLGEMATYVSLHDHQQDEDP
jgi:AAT family amino acid transporter